MSARRWIAATLLAATSAVAAGCATQQMLWTKPGFTQQAWQTDLAQCRYESQLATSTHPVNMAHAILLTAQRDSLFENCLRGRGYYEVRQ